MRNPIHVIVTSLVLSLISCSGPNEEKTAGTTPAGPDTALIKQLGADTYGMKQYTLVLLKTGPAQNIDQAELGKLQAAHLKDLRQQMEEGILVAVGPLTDGVGDIRGICIYNLPLEEAKTLAGNDPAVKAGAMVVEAHPWYGTAALMKVPEIHKTVETKSFADLGN